MTTTTEGDIKFHDFIGDGWCAPVHHDPPPFPRLLEEFAVMLWRGSTLGSSPDYDYGNDSHSNVDNHPDRKDNHDYDNNNRSNQLNPNNDEYWHSRGMKKP